MVDVGPTGPTATPYTATASCTGENDILLTGWCVLVTPSSFQAIGQFYYGELSNVAGNPMGWTCNGFNNVSATAYGLQAYASCITVP
jgi:hypothetical protein